MGVGGGELLHVHVPTTNSRPVSSQLAVQLSAQGNSTRATMLNSIYGMLSLLFHCSLSQCPSAFVPQSNTEATTMGLGVVFVHG